MNQREESVQHIDKLSNGLCLAMGMAGGSLGRTVEGKLEDLLDHARGLSAENLEREQALEELRREHAKDTKQHMEEIYKWFALRRTYEELKKLYETSVRVNGSHEATLRKIKADAALKLEAAARQHLKENEALCAIQKSMHKQGLSRGGTRNGRH
jgi:hypothetical protein